MFYEEDEAFPEISNGLLGQLRGTMIKSSSDFPCKRQETQQSGKLKKFTAIWQSYGREFSITEKVSRTILRNQRSLRPLPLSQLQGSRYLFPPKVAEFCSLSTTPKSVIHYSSSNVTFPNHPLLSKIFTQKNHVKGE